MLRTVARTLLLSSLRLSRPSLRSSWRYNPVRRFSTAPTLSKPPTLQVASDLHLEFFQNPKLTDFVTPSAPYLALAGDIGIPYLDSYPQFLEQCSRAFQKTFLITGNHEYYNWAARPPKEKWTMDKIDAEIQQLVTKLGNVYFLNNQTHSIHDGWIIAGSTLWSNILYPNLAERHMNDMSQIYVSEEFLSARSLSQIYQRNVDWIQQQTRQHADKKIIMMTHHLPSYKLVAPRYGNNPLNCCFASHLDHLMAPNVKYWISGHTHTAADKMLGPTGATRCVVNPLGYKREVSGYSPLKILDL